MIKQLILIAAIIFFPTKDTTQPQQEKMYTVSMKLNDWDNTLQSLNSTDDVALNSRKRIYANILSQIQVQLAAEKKVDSLKNKK